MKRTIIFLLVAAAILCTAAGTLSGYTTQSGFGVDIVAKNKNSDF